MANITLLINWLMLNCEEFVNIKPFNKKYFLGSQNISNRVNGTTTTNLIGSLLYYFEE